MTSYEARIETYGDPAELPETYTVINTSDRATLGAWLRREAAAIEPAPAVVPNPSAAVRRTPGPGLCSEFGCVLLYGHRGLHRPRIELGPATMSGPDYDTIAALRERDETLAELERTRQKADRLDELHTEAAGILRAVAVEAVQARQAAFDDGDDARFADATDVLDLIPANLGGLAPIFGPARPLSEPVGQDHGSRVGGEGSEASGPENGAQAAGKAPGRGSGWHIRDGKPITDAMTRYLDESDTAENLLAIAVRAAIFECEEQRDMAIAEVDDTDDRERPIGGMRRIADITNGRRIGIVEMANRVIGRLTDVIGQVAGENLAHLPEPDAYGRGWTAGVRWAAAEARAQARSGMADTDISDITDHLWLCADDPERPTAIDRDEAPEGPDGQAVTP